MNGEDELPSEHFWDSPEAEQEYHAIGQGIAEAEEQLSKAQGRLHIDRAIYTRFAAAPGANAVVRRGIMYSDGSGHIEKEEWMLDRLNQGLNPYWLPEGGRFEANHANGYSISHAPWRGSLVAVKVESETLQGAVGFGRHKKRSGDYVHLRLTFSYDKRVEWYTPTGDVGMSGMEWSLLNAQERATQAEDLSLPLLEKIIQSSALYKKLLEELIREVHTFAASLSQQIVLKFYPDLEPTNIDEIYLSDGEYKKDIPQLSWPPLAKYKAPKAQERYGLASYEDTCWINCGRWDVYQFPVGQLQAVRKRVERIEERLRERIAAAFKEVLRIDEEIGLLRRRREKIRILHYKPLIYKELWSLLGVSGMLTGGDRAADSHTSGRIEAPNSGALLQLPERATSRAEKENAKE